MTTAVSIHQVAKRFGEHELFAGVSFEVRTGEIFAVLGGSGCGKSTLMRLMIGLDQPTSGSIEVLGYDIARDVEAVRASIGVTFQSGALFGSLSLLENVMLPFTIFTDLPYRTRLDLARMKLALVGLLDSEALMPAEISGGMAKRAALARALALDPPLIFLDEPSAGLDPVSSASLDHLILDLRQMLGTTFVVITHELPSILTIADRCVMLDAAAKGVVAIGKPLELKQRSASPVVRAFFNREAA